jgi:hypothetical protein
MQKSYMISSWYVRDRSKGVYISKVNVIWLFMACNKLNEDDKPIIKPCWH